MKKVLFLLMLTALITFSCEEEPLSVETELMDAESGTATMSASMGAASRSGD